MPVKFQYDKSIKELESILVELENGEVDIDDLFLKVKKATELIKDLKQKLHQTESDVMDLLNKNNVEDE